MRKTTAAGIIHVLWVLILLIRLDACEQHIFKLEATESPAKTRSLTLHVALKACYRYSEWAVQASYSGLYLLLQTLRDFDDRYPAPPVEDKSASYCN
jgi:hypothetical protein